MKFQKQTKFGTLAEMQEYFYLEKQHIDGLDDRTPHQSWLKNQFRKSQEWKEFCKQLISRREKCERCGSDGKNDGSLQVHHLDPRNYNDLTEEKFKVLCGKCHLKIESFCGTEEKRKQCPNIDKQFLTYYPYKELDKDVLAKASGKFLKKKWANELNEKKNPGKWINVCPLSDQKKKEVKAALYFMKQYPNLFK